MSSRFRWVPRPFQALLALLLISVTAAAVWGGSYARNRILAFRYIESRHGYVESKRPEWCPAWLAIPRWLHAVDRVVFQVETLDDLRPLTALHELRKLSAEFEFDDSELRHLRHFPQLESLGLSFGRIGDGGVAAISECAHLQELSLNGPDVTDAGLKALTKFRLKSFKLRNARITEAGMADIASIAQRAEGLSLVGCSVTDDGLRHLVGLPLDRLNLAYTDITDAGLPTLSRLRLKLLDVSGTEVTPRGVRVLASMKTLRAVRVNMPPFSRGNIEPLKRAGVRISLNTLPNDEGW